MPRTFSIFSRHTTIILVDRGNLNMIQGDFRHIDHWTTIVRTTIINRDVYNIESPVTRRRLLRLSVMTVKTSLSLEASKALIYNGYIQRRPPWYLQIPPPHVMNMTEPQVRDVFSSTFKLTLTGCARMPDMPSYLSGTRGPIEMASLVHNTVSKFNHSVTRFYADIHIFGRRFHILMSVNESPFKSAWQHRSTWRIGSHLFVRKSNNGLTWREHHGCNTT